MFPGKHLMHQPLSSISAASASSSRTMIIFFSPLVRSFVCHKQKPLNSQKSSSFIILHSSFIHPSFILQLLSFSACQSRSTHITPFQGLWRPLRGLKIYPNSEFDPFLGGSGWLFASQAYTYCEPMVFILEAPQKHLSKALGGLQRAINMLKFRALNPLQLLGCFFVFLGGYCFLSSYPL